VPEYRSDAFVPDASETFDDSTGAGSSKTDLHAGE
jgi:hypothetical protein